MTITSDDLFYWRIILCVIRSPLQWRHNERDGVSNHRRLDCLLNSFFRRRSKKISKLRVTSPCERIHWSPVNSPHKGPITRNLFPFDDVIMRRINWLDRYTKLYSVIIITADASNRHSANTKLYIVFINYLSLLKATNTISLVRWQFPKRATRTYSDYARPKMKRIYMRQ